MIKHSKKLLISLPIVLSSACTTYHSNSNIEFASLHLSGQKPVLPIVKKLPADQVTYLGWINGEVYSPSFFHEAPTQTQVNIVMAEKAKQLQADAIMHVEYKKGFTITTKSRLSGRGQAVRINAWHIGEDDPNVIMADHEVNKPIDPFLTALEAEALEAETLNKNASYAVAQKTQVVEPNAESKKALTLKAQDISNDSSLLLEKPAPQTQLSTKPASDSNNTQAQTDSLYQMRSQALQIRERAKLHQDKALYKSASNLVHLVDQHILEYTQSFPE